jgi:RimJ/RimL family protein N-acetyltransferase
MIYIDKIAMKEIISTDRLILREFNDNDANFFMRLLNTEGWIKNIGDRNVRSEQDAIAYLNKKLYGSYTEHSYGMWCVVLKEGNIPIGTCGLVNRDWLEDIDIGFAFLPEYNGYGYAKESASATLLFAKEQFGIKRVVGITLTQNESSIKLLKRIGMKYEKTFNDPDTNEELMLLGVDF